MYTDKERELRGIEMKIRMKEKKTKAKKKQKIRRGRIVCEPVPLSARECLLRELCVSIGSSLRRTSALFLARAQC